MFFHPFVTHTLLYYCWQQALVASLLAGSPGLFMYINYILFPWYLQAC